MIKKDSTLPRQRTWVQSLTRELISCIPRGVVNQNWKLKNKKVNILEILNATFTLKVNNLEVLYWYQLFFSSWCLWSKSIPEVPFYCGGFTQWVGFDNWLVKVSNLENKMELQINSLETKIEKMQEMFNKDVEEKKSIPESFFVLCH